MLVADHSRIIDPRRIRWRVGRRHRKPGIRCLPGYPIGIDHVARYPPGRYGWRSYVVEVLEQGTGDGCRCRCRCRCRRVAFEEAEDLENLIGPYLIGHAGILSVPSNAARAVTVARILPGRARVRLNSPVVPEPLTVCIEILPRLYRDPMGSRVEGDGVGQTDRKVSGSSRVSQIEVSTHRCPRQIARAIAVKVHVERRRGTASFGIFTHHPHCSDINVDARGRSGQDEVVSSLIIKCVKCWLEILRADADRRFRGRIVVLIPKHSAVWQF